MEKYNLKPDIRERTMKYGISYPDDEELIMLILGSGTKQVPVRVMARRIIEALDSSDDGARVEKLLSLKGVGMRKALAVAAALEFGRRRSGHFKAKIRTPKDLIPFVQNYAMQQKEHFLCVTLNGGHEIIQIHVASVGTINRTLVHPREIFSEAIKENASAVILCHNHPSGNCSPSDDDISSTQNLLEASRILGITVLDHLIIGFEDYFSFMEHGLLFSPEF